MLDIIRKVPIPTAGVALGLAALGNLIGPLSEGARLLCGLSALFMVLLVAARAIAFPRSIQEDLRNPILASVSATLFMTMMQLAGYAAPFAFLPACLLWWAAVAMHLGLMVWFSWRFIRNLQLDQVFPTYFICYVGIIVASATSPCFGLEAVGSVLFGLGFACYPVLLVMITYRYLKHPVPEAARPLFCIYSAPASLSIVGYIAVTPDANLAFVGVLLALAQAFFLIVLVRLPKLMTREFFPSFAAMTFPFVITATALSCALDLFAQAGIVLPAALEQLAAAETVFAVGMVAFVFARYLVFLFKPAPKARPTYIAIEIAHD